MNVLIVWRTYPWCLVVVPLVIDSTLSIFMTALWLEILSPDKPSLYQVMLGLMPSWILSTFYISSLCIAHNNYCNYPLSHNKTFNWPFSFISPCSFLCDASPEATQVQLDLIYISREEWKYCVSILLGKCLNPISIILIFLLFIMSIKSFLSICSLHGLPCIFSRSHILFFFQDCWQLSPPTCCDMEHLLQQLKIVDVVLEEFRGIHLITVLIPFYHMHQWYFLHKNLNFVSCTSILLLACTVVKHLWSSGIFNPEESPVWKASIGVVCLIFTYLTHCDPHTTNTGFITAHNILFFTPRILICLWYLWHEQTVSSLSVSIGFFPPSFINKMHLVWSNMKSQSLKWGMYGSVFMADSIEFNIGSSFLK
jgi:hypothetical protein